jgi:hypothetical protein
VIHGEIVNKYNVEIGKIAFVKTSDEPVFVMNIDTDKNNNQIATVRRPIQTENGVVHSVDQFFLNELQTAQEKILEEFAIQKFGIEERDRMTEARQQAKATPAKSTETLLN